jgi:perosamine synthetase
MRRQGCRISWFVYVVQLAETFSLEQRDAIVRQLAERGIGCGRYFAPIHMQPAYQREKHRSMELPVTESIAPRTLALPFFNKITETEIEEVCDTLQELILKV